MVRFSTSFLLRDPVNHQYHTNFRGKIVVGIDQYGDRGLFERNFMASEKVVIEFHELFAFWNTLGLCSIDQLEFRWASV